MEIVT